MSNKDDEVRKSLISCMRNAIWLTEEINAALELYENGLGHNFDIGLIDFSINCMTNAINNLHKVLDEYSNTDNEVKEYATI